MALSCTILTHSILKNTVTLKSGSGVTKGHRNWYHSIAGLWLLLESYSNYVSEMHRFWDICL